jgi:hypothetical protein
MRIKIEIKNKILIKGWNWKKKSIWQKNPKNQKNKDYIEKR